MSRGCGDRQQVLTRVSPAPLGESEFQWGHIGAAYLADRGTDIVRTGSLLHVFTGGIYITTLHEDAARTASAAAGAYVREQTARRLA